MVRLLVGGILAVAVSSVRADNSFYEREEAYKATERIRAEQEVRTTDLKLNKILMKRISELASLKGTKASDIACVHALNRPALGDCTFHAGGLSCQIHEDISMESGCPHPKCMTINEYVVTCYDRANRKSETILPGFGPY